jgi:cell division protein ZapA
MMSTVKISILEHQYDISCENGMEEQVKKLGQELSNRLYDLKRSSGVSDQTRLLIMAGLLLIHESQMLSNQKVGKGDDLKTLGLVDVVEKLIKRVETLAEKLEKR